MKRTKFRLGLASALTFLWLCVIWGNSLLPGSQSSQVSGWVGELLEKILPFLNMGADGAMTVLRKLGHFSEFMLLSLCLNWLFGMLKTGKFVPVLCGIAVACADETIQLFVPGRHGCVTDVLIDSAGVAVGVLIVLLIQRCKTTGRR